MRASNNTKRCLVIVYRKDQTTVLACSFCTVGTASGCELMLREKKGTEKDVNLSRLILKLLEDLGPHLIDVGNAQNSRQIHTYGPGDHSLLSICRIVGELE
eukprot:Filipodium_phascolosomae@DN8077_c0_g1_i1.p1